MREILPIDGHPPEPVDALAQLAADAGASRIAEEARLLGERVAEGRFHVACVGQFKRSKSSVLNALVAGSAPGRSR